jgi:diacylglycerol kinase family enzyme
MRICLYWNESAGEGVSRHDLTALIKRAGHAVERIVDRVEDIPRMGDAAIDCVVAAGGDGTVARAGRALAFGDLPLAILPTGTANNIAASLGITGTPEAVIASWNDQQIQRIDVGVVRDSHGESVFLESVGTGLVAHGIATGDEAVPKGKSAAAQLAHARQLYLEALSHLRSRPYSITIDGASIDGEYLLVEVLNMPSIGPGIRLSADVSAADGALSVVVARETDREALAAYVSTWLTAVPATAGLESRHGRRIELKGLQGFHVDDDVRPAGSGDLEIGVRAACLPVLR